MTAASDGRFARVVAALHAAVMVEDMERRIELVNPAFCALFGSRYSPEQLAGQDMRPLIERWKPQCIDADATMADMDRAREQGRPAQWAELPPMRLTDGRILEREYTPIFVDGRHEAHLWEFRDVTDRHRTAEAMRDSEAHLRALYDQSPVGMFEADVDGSCRSVNARWQELAGMSAEQALGTGWMRAIHPDDRERLVEAWDAASAAGGPSQLEYRMATPSGRVSSVLGATMPVREGDRLTGYVGLVIDITDRKRAEDALGLSESRSAATIATAFDAIITLDYDGRMLELNAAAEVMFGHRREDAVGRSLIELLVPPSSREASRAGLEQYLRTGEWDLIGRRVERSMIRADGEVFTAEVAIVDIGEPPMLTAFMRDVSERRRFERQLAAARDRALEASRLKSEFLAIMSHEIRTPMYGVTGAVDLLADLELDAEQRELVEILDESSQTMLGLIDEILDFSKIEAGGLELEVSELDPAATVESATEVFAAQARRNGLSLMSVIAPDVPAAIRGDAGRLRQVVANLVGNAVKFTDSGEVIVRLSVAPSERLRIEVSDSGPGIPRSVRNTLFEPFTQGDPSSRRAHGGTGLGLAICERLVRLMGGIITVGGPPEGGATMTVVIPGRAVAGARPAWEPPAALRGRTAAVAMSNPRLAQAMCEALRGLGMIVPESVEPTGVDVWVAEVAGGRGVPTGATIAVLGEDERGTGPLPVRRARLAEILVHALEAAPVHVAVPGELAQAPAADPAPADALVLVAEDNAVNRTLALRQLEHLGVTARGVATGPEAVEAVGRDRYDAVLMDRRMPEMDGIDATRAIRASERPGEHRTPIIAMTADAQPNDRELCLAAGMDDYLSKPITLQDLRRALAPWLAWQSDAAPEPAASRDGPLDALAVELRSRAAVVELIELWLRELPGRRAALQAAVAAGDPPAISEVAHVLVSTSALFGAAAASEAAAKLEAAARRGGAPSARELGALERELDDAAHRLRTWCATAAQPLTEP